MTIYLAQPVYNEQGDPNSMVGPLEVFDSEEERDNFVKEKNEREHEYEFWVSHDVDVPDCRCSYED